MRTAGQYRLQQALSSCEVGDVWSGADDRGRSVTVAVLNERASVDGRWRGAFAAAADALAQASADQLPIVGADHAGPRPWVACASERGAGAAQIFEALGQRLQPASAPTPAANQDPHAEEPTAWTPLVPQQSVAQPAPNGSPPASREDTRQGHNPWDLPPAPAGDDLERTTAVPRQRPAQSPVRPMSTQPVSAQPVPAQPVAPAQHVEPATQPVPVQPVGQSGYHPPGPVGYPLPGDHPAMPSSPAQPTSGHPFSPYPNLADVYPNSPVSGHPISGSPVSGGDSYPPYRSRVFDDQPPAKPRRNGLLITIVAVAGLLVGGGGVAAVMALGRDGKTPTPATTTAAAPLTDEQLLLPATPPAAPGVEPPRGGGWPSGWPTFTSAESTKPMNNLDGVGFDFRLPPTWGCTKAEQSTAAVHYRCGVGGSATFTSGGDLIVRACQKTCTEDRRTALRQREEAWGLRWTRSGPFTTWAETTKIDGKRVYGLVYVAFWRSTPEGEIDRELVLRMTAPLATSDDLKKVANSIRDKTFTL
jgi:hypothetical protein